MDSSGLSGASRWAARVPGRRCETNASAMLAICAWPKSSREFSMWVAGLVGSGSRICPRPLLTTRDVIIDQKRLRRVGVYLLQKNGARYHISGRGLFLNSKKSTWPLCFSRTALHDLARPDGLL